MQLTTPLTIPPSAATLNYTDTTLLLGSCFAQHIGTLMQQNKLKVDINPFGILYNPTSVAMALRRLMHPTPFVQEDLFAHNHRWHSFHHHSHFSAPQPDEALQQMNSRLAQGAAQLRSASWLMVTWGTAYVYYHEGRVVANCHKLPERNFERRRLTPTEVVAQWQPLVEELRAHNPHLQLLFTVSPIRHLRDGAHANQLSKSVLLLAIEELCALYPHCCHYYPSYEIVMDELRDYRFYATDMVHPSPLAVEYIWERFIETYFSPKAKEIQQAWSKMEKLLNHRPLDDSSAAYKDFIEKNIVKAEAFQKKYPYIELSNEINALRSKQTL